MLCTFIVGVVLVSQDKSELVPTAAYTETNAQPGDDLVLWTEPKFRKPIIAFDYFAMLNILKFDRANDQVGIVDLVTKHRADIVESGTKIKYVKKQTTLDDVDIAEVRVMEGEQKDKLVWVYHQECRRMVTKEQLAAMRAPSEPRAASAPIALPLPALPAEAPQEIVKAIKAAKAAAGTADASLRKRVLAREKTKRLSALATKYGVSNQDLARYIEAKGLDR